MLDRSSFSCLATFFHFDPGPLSVSSLSEDSWAIQAVPPSALLRLEMDLILDRRSCSHCFLSLGPKDKGGLESHC